MDIRTGRPPDARGGDGIAGVTSFADITASRPSSRASRLLAEASELLASSLDLKATFEALARRVVPELADECRVELLLEGGVRHQVALTSSDPSREQLARELSSRVLQTG